MRLWHEKLIPILPSAQLNGQHQECCALRGNGWGKKHSTVNYVFNHSPLVSLLFIMFGFSLARKGALFSLALYVVVQVLGASLK